MGYKKNHYIDVVVVVATAVVDTGGGVCVVVPVCECIYLYSIDEFFLSTGAS